MEVRRVVSRVVMGVAMTGAVALIVFVGVPWLTAPASVSVPEGTLERVPWPQSEDGLEAVGGMELREAAPEHPVLGLLSAVTEKTEPGAEAGELPPPLSPEALQGAMSEFLRVASASDVDWEDERERNTGMKLRTRRP